MQHLGDITKLDGAAIEPVWCVTGGSPCQDLSIAGKRAGLAGARSGLFMEQIRVIKEMREHDKQLDWAGELIRPRYMVWENVPGALSSNKGRDFAAVLEETIRIVEPEAPGIEVPAKGWPTWGGYRDVDGRWSVAWRVHDAQYWGVPQRRRRIALVADFGGDTAHEILFERTGVSGDLTPRVEAGERPAGSAESGVNPAIRDCLTAWDCQSKRIFYINGKSPTLQGGVGGGVNNPAIFCMATQQGGAELRTDDRAPTLTAAAGMSGNNQPVVAIPINEKAKTSTLWAGNDQTIFQGAAYGICSYASNSMLSGNPHSGIYEADTSRTMDLNGGNPACNQGGIAVVQPVAADLYNATLTGDTDATVTTRTGQYGDASGPSALCAAFKLGNSEQARSIGYQEELSPTLNAECGGNKPAVVAPAVVLDMTHACDVIRECGEIAPSLQARMGTGGNQVPLTYQYVTGTLSPGAHAGSYNGQDAYNDMLVCGVLDMTHDAQAILYQPKSAMEENWEESETKNALRAGESKVSHAVLCEDVSHALRAKANCAYREDAETYPVQNMVVRRLTPLECERLQGFPDGWTDIGDYTDSTGKKRKTSDSARYKAIGNSIALPFWRWMFGRMAVYLPEGATLGSLFDGIGGFPLCWEDVHGTGTAIWASEIEEFPIAVTKKRFGGAIT